MGNKFASARNSIAECDCCGFQFKLRELKKLVVKGKLIESKVCPACWVPDQPQLMLGEFPVDDPQAVRDPRPDTTYYASGADGAGGSRIIQWGWGPVGGSYSIDAALTPNDLAPATAVNDVTVTIS
jgi:hypothetical protein